MKIHQHIAGHMTKMAAMAKHFKNLLSRILRADLMKLCMKHQRPKTFILCSNYDPGLTLIYFICRQGQILLLKVLYRKILR